MYIMFSNLVACLPKLLNNRLTQHCVCFQFERYKEVVRLIERVKKDRGGGGGGDNRVTFI